MNHGWNLRWLSAVLLFGATSYAITPPALSRTTEDIEPGLSDSVSTEVVVHQPRHYYGRQDLNAGLDIQYIPIAYKNYQWFGSQNSPQMGSGVHVAVEWLPLSRYGKLGVGLGLGYYLIRNVTFDDGRHASLNTFPLEGFLTYRLDYVPNQILVPFAKVGADTTFAGQTHGPAGGPQIYYGFDYGAGLELCLNNLDKHAARDMATSIGIYNTYVVFEYLKSQDLKGRRGPDLRHEEYRFGLRFEM